MQFVYKADGIEPTTSCPTVSLCVQLSSVKTNVDRMATDVELLRMQITSGKEDIRKKTVKSAANLYILSLPSLPLFLSLVLSSSVSLSPATHHPGGLTGLLQWPGSSLKKNVIKFKVSQIYPDLDISCFSIEEHLGPVSR